MHEGSTIKPTDSPVTLGVEEFLLDEVEEDSETGAEVCAAMLIDAIIAKA